MNQLRFSASRLRVSAPSRVLPVFGVSLCALACGSRYEIGDIVAKQTPQQRDGGSNAVSTTAAATVSAVPRTIIRDAYDVDASVAGSIAILPLGDVDGDGYGDWTEEGDPSSLHIAYGAPRPEAGGVLTPDRRSFDFAVDGPGLPQGGGAGPAGDVNGDGYADLFISYPPIFVSATRSAVCCTPADVAQGTLASQGTRWDTPLAFLLLGGPDRALGPQPPPSGPMAFGDRDELATQFASELAFDAQNTLNYATQYMYTRGLGDLDHDGFDDFSVTTTFFYYEAAISPSNEPDGLSEVTELERRSESVSYLVYGSSSPESSTAAAARLAGISAVYPAGDVNGDGFGDLLLIGPDRIYLWSGGAEHPSGDLQLQVDAVPIDGTTPSPGDYLDSTGSVGDLDHDGYADFLVNVASTDDAGASHQLALLFYGSANIFSTPLAASAAHAVFDLEPYATVQRAGDWNADGFDDLVIDHQDLRYLGQQFTALTETRLLPGTAQRWTGKITVPDDQLAMLANSADARDPEYVVTPAGDLDGDGFADLLLRRCFPAPDPLAPAYSKCDTTDTAIKYGGALPPLPTPIR